MNFKNRLWLELLAIYGLTPIAIALLRDRWIMLTLLWGAAITTIWWLRTQRNTSFKQEWHSSELYQHGYYLLKRLLIILSSLTAFVWLLHPDAMFSFPQQKPAIWAMVMILYPILSVIPQELIYRTLLFKRYNRIIPQRYIVAASAILFGYMHIILLRWEAVVLTAIAGLLLARSYEKTKSLAVISVEHALYGCWAYTVGLGMYFYTGANW